MSRKLTCPGCNAHTSAVATAFSEGEPCPYCGLSAAAATKVVEAQQRNADAELTKKYAEAVKDRDAAERRADAAEFALLQVRQALQKSGL